MTIVCWNCFCNPSLLNPPLHKLQALSGVWGRFPQEINFLDFNSLKSHFLGLQVIIKDRILVRFQLGQCFLLFKYLSWKIWPISGENQCGFPAEKVSEKWVQKLLYILSMTIVFIWNCFHHPSPPNHPSHTSTYSLWSRLRERPTFCKTTAGFLARWCLRNELKNFYSVNMSLRIQVVLLIGWTMMGKCCIISVEFLHLFLKRLISRGNHGFQISAVFSGYSVCKISY